MKVLLSSNKVFSFVSLRHVINVNLSVCERVRVTALRRRRGRGRGRGGRPAFVRREVGGEITSRQLLPFITPLTPRHPVPHPRTTPYVTMCTLYEANRGLTGSKYL